MKEERLFNPRQLTSSRLARGFTIKDLSEKTEVSRQAISSYESGKVSPKFETALKIANVLDFPVNFLYDKSMMLPEVLHTLENVVQQQILQEKCRKNG